MIELPAAPPYVATARLFAAAAARHFGVGEADVEDARLAVSEIVTASLVRAGTGPAGGVRLTVAPAPDGAVAFRVDVPGRLPAPADDQEAPDGFGGEDGFAVSMSLRLIHELFSDTSVESVEPDRTVVGFSLPPAGQTGRDEVNEAF